MGRSWIRARVGAGPRRAEAGKEQVRSIKKVGTGQEQEQGRCRARGGVGQEQEEDGGRSLVRGG